MKRPTRHADGMYHVNGKKYKELFGSRTQVMNGTACKTSGGLMKSGLTMNKWGRIVSLKKMRSAKKENRLKKYGYTAKKGAFGAVKIGSKSRKSRKMLGGMAEKLVGETFPAQRGVLSGTELSTAYGAANTAAPAGGVEAANVNPANQMQNIDPVKL